MTNKLRLLFAMLFLSAFSLAQNTVLFGTGAGAPSTVVDTGGQSWINSNFTMTLVVPSGGGTPHYIDGTVAPSSYRGTVDSTGNINILSVGNTDNILPTGSTWTVCFQPLASAPQQCFPGIMTRPVAGGDWNHNFIPRALQIEAGNSVFAYSTAEIINSVTGNSYTNTITGCGFLFTSGSSYVALPCSGSGSGCTTDCVVTDPPAGQDIIQTPGTAFVVHGGTGGAKNVQLDGNGSLDGTLHGYAINTDNGYTVEESSAGGAGISMESDNGPIAFSAGGEVDVSGNGVDIDAAGGTANVSGAHVQSNGSDNCTQVTGCPSSSGSVTSSSTINAANTQTLADSIVTSNLFGLTTFGDSLTCGLGVTGTQQYVVILANDMNIALSAINNQCVAGDDAGDQTWHIFSTINPGDTSNPITTTMIGTNDLDLLDQPSFTKFQYAGNAWGALSSTNKILAGNAAVTATGTWTADTTFANAHGLTSSTATNTLSYPAQIGPTAVFYVWYKMTSSGGSFTQAVDGSPATDTVSGGTTISTAWGTGGPIHQTSSVGLARFVTTRGAHTLLTTVASGSVTILGYGFAPVIRYRGSNGPRVMMAGVVPQQNNADGSNVAAYNTISLNVSKRLVADGLDIPFVDVNNGVDYGLDFDTSATQNCLAATSPPFHPNNCGYLHIAQAFESLIGSMPMQVSNQTTRINLHGVPSTTTLPGTANGDSTTGTDYPSGGSIFPPATYCMNGFVNFGWCFTYLELSSIGRSTITTTNSSGSIAFAWIPTNATPAQVDSAPKTWFDANQNLHAQALYSLTNCNSIASPATCGSASTGSVVIPTGTTSSALVVDTTAVTAGSTIFFYPDASLGTKLGVTCNSTLATLIGGSAITARTPGTSFTITFNGTIVTNGVCGGYTIIN